jgi:hypothetical protein
MFADTRFLTGDDIMKGRSGALISALGVLVLLTMVGAYLLMQGKEGRPSTSIIQQSPTAWDDEDEHRTSRTDRSRDGADADRARRDADAGTATTQAADAEDDRAGGGITGGAGGWQEGDELPEIDPAMINERVPGHLIVRVLSREADRPLVGASVFFPIRGTTLDSDAGEVRLNDRLNTMMRRTNRYGVAVWNQDELKELLEMQGDDEDRTSVLATAYGYADFFEPMNIPSLERGAEVTFRLFPAVRVTGRVRVHRGSIVPDVAVDILQTSGQAESEEPLNRFRVTTDSMGEFSVRLAESYMYVFEVRHTGFANYRSRVFNFREDTREVSILLEPAQGISGMVVDGSGQGIEGAEVWDRGEDERVSTDENGHFVFARIRDRIFSNEVNLRASAEGYAPRNQTVLANDHEIRIQLEDEGSVHGVVMSSRGEPVAGATVRADLREGRQRFPLEPVQTDEAGEFRFGMLGQGRVELTATHGDEYSEQATVNTRPGETAGPVTLRLQTGAVITGRVTAGGSPLRGVTIALDGEAAGGTGQDGVYTLTGVSEGAHRVRILNQYPVSDDTLAQLPIFTVDGEAWYYLPGEREVSVQLGESETVDFEVEPFDADIDRKINLRIVTQPSEPVSALEFTLRPVLGSPPEGVPAPETLTRTLALPDGNLTLPLALVNGVRYEASFEHNYFFTVTLSAEELDAVQDGGSIDVVLERAFVIKGHVRDSDGNAIEGVSLSMPNRPNVTTDVYGYFEFGQLQAGEYRIRAWRHSYYQENLTVNVSGRDPDPLEVIMVNANEIRIIVSNYGTPQPGARLHVYRHDAASQDPDAFMRHFDIGTTDARGEKYVNLHWIRNYQIIAYYNDRVAFANFNNLREVPEREFTIELEPSYPLEGRVLDEVTQQPLSGVHIRAHLGGSGVSERDGNFFQLQTDGSGRFRFRVPVGDYHFYVPQTRSHEGYSSEPNRVPAGSTGLELLVPMRDDVQGNYAQIQSVSAPQNMVAGQRYEVQVVVRNMGSSTWTRAGNRPHRLGSQNPRGNRNWGTNRAHLPEGMEVPPGATHVFTFTVTAPAEAGTYNMQWQMLQERREWFGTLSENLRITVTGG